MKIRTKFTVLGSLAVLSIIPMTFAEEVAIEPQIAECWEGITEFIEEPMIIECPGSYEIDPEVYSGEPTDEGTFENEEEYVGEEVIFENKETSIDGEIIDEEVTFNEEENIDDEGTTTDGEVDEEVTNGEIVEVTDGGEESYPEIPEDGEGFVIPLDWIKRGGGDNPEIFYSMASGVGPMPTPTAEFKSETSPIARQIGPDSKATAIEGRENLGAFQANRDKKGAVALVKEGRVFLR